MAKKIILILVVLAVAFLSLSELRAGKKAAENITVAPAPVTSSAPQETEPQQEPSTVPDMTEEQQNALIMDHYDLWSEAWDHGSDWSYTITDLDHNGRLEVITATLQGTGLFTWAEVWEVREDFSGLVKCEDGLGEGEAYPDIITEAVNCYYDAAEDVYYYLFDDLARSGMAENYTAKVMLCLRDGKVELTTVCSRYEQYEDPEADPLITYRDASGNEISQEAYEQAVANWVTGMTMSDCEFDWTEVRGTF